MRGKKIGEQASVQEIDCERTGHDVGAAFLLVAPQHFNAAEILAVLVRIGHNFGDGGRIANPED